jgi:RimJ/RimL family protein N-acetyltransferase
MSDSTSIHFRPLRVFDLPLMVKWLNTDLVRDWYSKKEYTYEEAVRHYAPYIQGSKPTKAFLILSDKRPIGYIQTYTINDYPDYQEKIQIDERAAGLDLFIGEPDFIHRGLGSTILQQFLREVVFGQSDAISCIVGPEPRNTTAIRAYEKAGFTHLKTIETDDEAEAEYLMRIERAGVMA